MVPGAWWYAVLYRVKDNMSVTVTWHRVKGSLNLKLPGCTSQHMVKINTCTLAFPPRV
jgi:hypothetical protein